MKAMKKIVEITKFKLSVLVATLLVATSLALMGGVGTLHGIFSVQEMREHALQKWNAQWHKDNAHLRIGSENDNACTVAKKAYSDYGIFSRVDAVKVCGIHAIDGELAFMQDDSYEEEVDYSTLARFLSENLDTMKKVSKVGPACLKAKSQLAAGVLSQFAMNRACGPLLKENPVSSLGPCERVKAAYNVAMATKEDVDEACGR